MERVRYRQHRETAKGHVNRRGECTAMGGEADLKKGGGERCKEEKAREQAERQQMGGR